MRRRRFLGLSGAGTGLLAAGGASLLAGCLGDFTGTDDPASPGTDTDVDLPDGVYVQRFRETMSMQGTVAAGPYEVAFMYAAPHVFWNVNGSDVSRTPRSGDIHGMAAVWDPATDTVVPETGLSLEIERDGSLVSEEVIYPMLSQRMGFHYGANFGLDGDGEYTARLSVGAIPDAVTLTGEYEGRFRERATAEIAFAFDEEERSKVESVELDAYGQRGAVEPMEMEMLPRATAPPSGELPGAVLGEPLSDDAKLTTVVVEGDAASRFGGTPYLVVSARTRYNGLVLPAMGLSATVDRGSETVFDGPLTRTLDPELGYHYGAVLDSLESGDEVTLSVTTPPQVARHEGYERAFLQMEDVSVSV